MPGSASAEHQVVTRRIDLEDLFGDLPRHFASDGDLIVSHLAATLSAMFPDGEDFFVRSVRRFRDQVPDEALATRVRGFIGQETMHGREHRAFNRRLTALGYPTARYERVTRRYLAVRERLFTPRSNLAATAAVEHFTATLAELLLSDDAARDLFDHQGARGLLAWHALEECEHKAVAFDLYRAVGGSERTRTLTMTILRFSFVMAISVAVVLSLLGDRDTYHLRTLRTSWGRVRRSPFADKHLWLQLCEYNRPDFHPDERDTSALVEDWRRTLFGDSGTLKNKLVAATAATTS